MELIAKIECNLGAVKPPACLPIARIKVFAGAVHRNYVHLLAVRPHLVLVCLPMLQAVPIWVTSQAVPIWVPLLVWTAVLIVSPV
jgi:hypothetical protein